MTTINDFNELFLADRKTSSPHLLVGNGFSRGFSKSFSYEYLVKDKPFTENMKASTDILSDACYGADVETWMTNLKLAANVLKSYEGHSSAINDLESDANSIIDFLLESISNIHKSPRPHTEEIGLDNALDKLIQFQNIYTLNYDILLSYIATRSQISSRKKNKLSDGFSCHEKVKKPHTYWYHPYYYLPKGKQPKQRLYFLHGAMNIYQTKNERGKLVTHKISVEPKDNSIASVASRVKSALVDRMYQNENFTPMVITEGTKEAKHQSINRSRYLSTCYSQFQHESGILYIFGCKLDSKDEHIMEAIAKSNLTKLRFSIWTGESSERSYIGKEVKRYQRIVKIREKLKSRGYDLPDFEEVEFFDAGSLDFWSLEDKKLSQDGNQD